MWERFRASRWCLPDERLNLLGRAKHGMVSFDPYPHLVVDEALDESVYARLEREYPGEELIRKGKHVANRDQLTAEEMETLPGVSELWRRFVRLHTSQAFFRQVAVLFAEAVRRAYPWLPDELGTSLEEAGCGIRRPSAPELPPVCLDCQPGLNTVSLAPATVRSAHLDAPNKLFTGLFYLKPPGDTSQGGDFLLYRPRQVPPPFETPSTILEEHLEVAKTVPYGRNRAVFFLNTPWAIHGVSVRDGSPIPRRLVNWIAGCYRLPRKTLYPAPPNAEAFAATRLH